MVVGRLGPIGIGDLADRVGRDYTTVSRQITKLEGLGFVDRQPGATDGRVRDVVITGNGTALTDRIDTAREAMARIIFEDWSEQDIADLARLMRRFADAVTAEPGKSG